jgi:predicted enzyme related to lactoylglutathione lyase
VLKELETFSGYSVDNIESAVKFYQDVLGLVVKRGEMGIELVLQTQRVFLYEKPTHQPASFTVLNFITKDINSKIDEMVAAGVVFEQYEGLPAKQDSRGVLRGLAAGQGPDIAWFKDPAGNVLALMQTAS